MPWIVVSTLTVFVPLLLIYFYVGKKLLNALVRVRGWQRNSTRTAMVGTLACVNVFPLIVLLAYLIGGQRPVSAFTGENFVLDLLFVYPFWFALVIVVQMFLVCLLSDAARLFLRPLYRKFTQRWRDVESRLLLCVLGAVVLYSIAVIAEDTWGRRVEERVFSLPARAAGLDGLRIVHIADVQGDGRTNSATIHRYVATVNSLKPDVVLFAGDLVTSGERYIGSTAELMGEIKATHWKIAAVGDHDIFADKRHVMEDLSAHGFLIAEDTTLILPFNGTKIGVSLATYTYRQRVEPKTLLKVAGMAAQADFRIFLVHQPAEPLVEFAQQHGYHLFAAGHTHGGGIAFGIPGLFLFAPASVESRYMSGFYDVGKMIVSVNNGLGMTLAPIRYHAPATITLLRFVR